MLEYFSSLKGKLSKTFIRTQKKPRGIVFYFYFYLLVYFLALVPSFRAADDCVFVRSYMQSSSTFPRFLFSSIRSFSLLY